MGFSRQEYWSGLPFPSPERWVQIPELPLASCEQMIKTLFFFPSSFIVI